MIDTTKWYDGRVMLGNSIYDVQYRFVDEDQIFCIRSGFYTGFYTHYKSLIVGD